MRLASEKEKFSYLGAPGNTSNLSSVKTTMPLKLSWKLDYTVKAFSCHKILVPHIEQIYMALAKLDPLLLRKSGMEIFGGCYNFRPVRGTESRDRPPFSTHSWGAAIDCDPVRNGLHTKAPRANLSHPDFQPVHIIWAQKGFINMGHVIGRDFMHYEASYELISNPTNFL